MTTPHQTPDSSLLPDLVFGKTGGRAISCADSFYGAINRENRVALDFRKGPGSFAFSGAILGLPQLSISNSASGPCEIRTSDATDHYSVIVPLRGHGSILSDGAAQDWQAADDIILGAYRDAQALRFATPRAQLVFEADAGRLAATASAMHGREVDAAELALSPTTVLRLGKAGKARRRMLVSALSLVDASEGDVAHLQHIGLDDVILRLLVELAFGAEEPQAHGTPMVRGRRSERAVDIICERLAQPDSRPMTMTEMEQATGLSSRALGYAFNERFGCSPQAWQRELFLERARAALLGRSGLASVKAVARKFGFASSDAFTRFYTRRYGERPSQTLARP